MDTTTLEHKKLLLGLSLLTEEERAMLLRYIQKAAPEESTKPGNTQRAL